MGAERRRVFALAAILAALPAAPVAGEGFSHAALDTVLARVVRDGRVDYGALLRDHRDLDLYLAAVTSARPDAWPRKEQFAFWVNAYNALVLDGVIRRPGIRSVLDEYQAEGVRAPGFFREPRAVGGVRRSLDEIENRILRERFRDPRVHFVLNCASASCPTLPARALRASTLDVDLDSATRVFLADTTRNRVDAEGNLWLSAIFQWYEDDFRKADGSVRAFVDRYRTGGTPPGHGSAVHYLEYDWSLNGRW